MRDKNQLKFEYGLEIKIGTNEPVRKMVECCKNDIHFMWILDEEDTPDHSTITRFQNEKLSPVIEDLFYQFINKLCEMGEVGFKNVFIVQTTLKWLLKNRDKLKPLREYIKKDFYI